MCVFKEREMGWVKKKKGSGRDENGERRKGIKIEIEKYKFYSKYVTSSSPLPGQCRVALLMSSESDSLLQVEFIKTSWHVCVFRERNRGCREKKRGMKTGKEVAPATAR